MIRSFGDKKAAALSGGGPHKRWKAFDSIADAALCKLDMLDAAVSLDDLWALPGNQLEALSGDRKGQYGIRINGQRRICFVWDGGDAREVEIVGYH
jgi:proteic killer suppression protein